MTQSSAILQRSCQLCSQRFAIQSVYFRTLHVCVCEPGTGNRFSRTSGRIKNHITTLFRFLSSNTFTAASSVPAFAKGTVGADEPMAKRCECDREMCRSPTESCPQKPLLFSNFMGFALGFAWICPSKLIP